LIRPKQAAKAARAVKPISPSAKAMAVPEQTLPSRAPVRRIIGAGNTVTQPQAAKPGLAAEVALSLVVPEIQAEPTPVRASTPTPIEIKDISPKKPVVLSPQLAWTALPKYVPARFLLGMALKYEQSNRQCFHWRSSYFTPRIRATVGWLLYRASCGANSRRWRSFCRGDSKALKQTFTEFT
jgi:hypothetical protein